MESKMSVTTGKERLVIGLTIIATLAVAGFTVGITDIIHLFIRT